MKKLKVILNSYTVLIGILLLQTGCNKFLDAKSDASLSIPETFEDLRALMNNETKINQFYPSLIESGSDDYYVKSNILKARSEAEQLVYTWTKSQQASDEASWQNPYSAILVTNVVLEGLDRVKDGSTGERDILRGEALFVRSYALFYLSQIFCLPYREEDNGVLLGLPLRTSSDFSLHYERASLEETYSFILEGIIAATNLLPERTEFKTRPTKAAAYAALARIYLVMGKFYEANDFAKKALVYNSSLLDYNTLNKSLSLPIPIGHEEIIYYSFCNTGYLLGNSRAFIPRELFDSYAPDDLRKDIFFGISRTGDIQFKGNYDGQGALYFSGLPTDELYLIRAECEIRSGRVTEGTELLNDLLKKRYLTDKFTGYKALAKEEALDLVLVERRKELIKRGLRWIDLRRLLSESGRVGTLYRKSDNGVDNDIYRLEPKVNNYIYPIPPNIMRLGVYQQNPL